MQAQPTPSDTAAFLEANIHFDLRLDRLWIGQQYLDPDNLQGYRELFVRFLDLSKLFIYSPELILRFGTDDFDKVFVRNHNIIRIGEPELQADGTYLQKYVDLGAPHTITRDDLFYDHFLCIKLSQIDLIKADICLEYHLLRNFGNDFVGFARFLRQCIRLHKDILLRAVAIPFVEDWISMKEKQLQQQHNTLQLVHSEDPFRLPKGRPRRTANDKLTCLSQQQTGLLLHLLQQQRVVLRDEYLSDQDAGRAMELLTGFSQHTLRQCLPEARKEQNKADLIVISNLLTRLEISISQALRKDKP
jgi:hypothetical protein